MNNTVSRIKPPFAESLLLLLLLVACTVTSVDGPDIATDDVRILLSDPDGQLFLLDITTGQRQVLSPPGVYKPSGLAGFVHLWAPVRLSPDGQWLAVPQPDSNGTWLVNLKDASQSKIYPHAVSLTWSPDSRQIAFYDPGSDSPDILYLQNVYKGEGSRPLARLEGKLLSSGWSPTGLQIAVVYSLDRGQIDSLLEIALVAVPSGKVEKLGQFPVVPTEATAWDLAWTPDGREVWHLQGRVAFPVDGKPPRPLAAEPLPKWLTARSWLRPWLTAGPPGSEPVFSPDGSQATWATSGEPQDKATIWIASIKHPETRSVIAEELGPIVQISWTEDGQIALAASETDMLAEVWRINPATEDAAQLVDEVYFISSLWNLKQSSTNVALTANLCPLSTPDMTEAWPTYTSVELGVSFQHPPEWKVWSSPTSAMVTLSSVAFDRLDGWASLSEDTLIVSISKIQVSAQDIEWWLDQNVYSIADEVQDMTVDNHIGLRWQRRILPIYESVVVPLDDGTILTIHKYPANSTYDTVFEQVLDSFQIEPR
jgi:WD40 repeat protein